MIHNRAGRKLKRTASHRKALLCNLATSLFEFKRITTTEAKAKELRCFAEPLITRAKRARINETSGSLAQGHKFDIHNRRMVARTIRKKAVLEHLFDTIAPKVEHRNGGYLRIIKLGQRRGDAGRMACIEFVDFNESTLLARESKQNKARNASRRNTVSALPAAASAINKKTGQQSAPAHEEIAQANDSATNSAETLKSDEIISQATTELEIAQNETENELSAPIESENINEDKAADN